MKTWIWIFGMSFLVTGESYAMGPKRTQNSPSAAAGAVSSQSAIRAEALSSPQSLQAPGGLDLMVNGVMTSEMLQRDALIYRGNQISKLVPNSDLVHATAQGALFGALTRYMSENPNLFGGNPNRGFTPKIWKALVSAYMKKTPLMTSDGILLSPPTGFEVRFSPNAAQITAKGNYSGVRLFMVNSQGRLVGPALREISTQAFRSAEDDELSPIGSQVEDFATYGGLTDLLSTHAMTLSSGGQEVAAAVVQEEGDVVLTLSDCFSLAADEQWANASDCFKSVGENGLAQGASLGKDFFVTAVRGGAVGAAVGAAVPGWGAGAGAAFGALSNMMSVVYNAFLKKEKITQKQFENLMTLFSVYGFSPNAHGQIMPRPGTRWLVTKSNVARLATEINGRLTQVDILGRPIMAQQYFELGTGTRSLGLENKAKENSPSPATNAAPAAVTPAATAPAATESAPAPAKPKAGAPAARRSLRPR